MKSIFIFILILVSAFTFVSCKSKNKYDDVSGNSASRHVCTYDFKTETVPATCESNGYTLNFCSCGNTQKSNETDPLGHTWLDWHVEATPTVNTTGLATRSCENGHTESFSLPRLSFYDYTIAALDDTKAPCLTPVPVRCTYEISGDDQEIDTESTIEFISEYQLYHTYTVNYVTSDIKHYPICDICSTIDESSAQNHNLSYGECIVCGYFDQGIVYSAEEYGLAASYSANDLVVNIPEFYLDHYIPNENNKIKGIKSFANNTHLHTITIPASIEYIDDYAFEGCTMLKRVYYNGTWDQWCSIRFGEMANPMNYADEFYIYNGTSYDSVSTITLTDATSMISSYAFEGFDEIAALIIPKSVTVIGDGDGAVFESDIRIGKIYYGGDVSDWCGVRINTLESSPTRIADTFYMTNSDGEYYRPTDLVIPSSIERIGNYQFTDYYFAKSLVFEGSIEAIGDQAFYGCLNIVTVDLSHGCENLSDYAFSGCRSIRTIYLPCNLKVSGNFAFYECSGMEHVYLKGSISDWCKIEFKSATSTPLQTNSLRSASEAATLHLYSADTETYFSTNSRTLMIPEGITKIGNYQFYGLGNVAEIVLSEGVTSIGDMAIAYCKNMRTLAIPESVIKIGDKAFKGCDTRLEIYYSGTADSWGKIIIGKENTELNAVTLIYEKYEAE